MFNLFHGTRADALFCCVFSYLFQPLLLRKNKQPSMASCCGAARRTCGKTRTVSRAISPISQVNPRRLPSRRLYHLLVSLGVDLSHLTHGLGGQCFDVCEPLQRELRAVLRHIGFLHGHHDLAGCHAHALRRLGIIARKLLLG